MGGTEYVRQLPETIYLAYGEKYEFYVVLKTLDDHSSGNLIVLGVKLVNWTNLDFNMFNVS